MTNTEYCQRYRARLKAAGKVPARPRASPELLRAIRTLLGWYVYESRGRILGSSMPFGNPPVGDVARAWEKVWKMVNGGHQ
ncbi:hypothetical protein [Methylocaldum sp.]|uniref:hypothetical protein n=1 Tax=Methylocaldum sp. TaxID=1969727 RepID=UPI002D4C367F|nr:hypothetical protein [Methylocaldum sp.]HYE36123.1 hypothetical protein [Methylocaldum sp.]